MSDKRCAHGFFLAKGCDECRDYERLVESQASDNAMIRDLTAKLQAAEAELNGAHEHIEKLNRAIETWKLEENDWAEDAARLQAEVADLSKKVLTMAADRSPAYAEMMTNALYEAKIKIADLQAQSDPNPPQNAAYWKRQAKGAKAEVARHLVTIEDREIENDGLSSENLQHRTRIAELEDGLRLWDDWATPAKHVDGTAPFDMPWREGRALLGGENEK